jgi:putative oxidoreductase
MERTKKVEIITFIAAVLLLLLFVYGALSKLATHQMFLAEMKRAPLSFMRQLAPLLSWLVPVIMGTVVVLLCFERWRRQGLYASFFLLLVFEIYIGGLLLSGRMLPCSCSGIHASLLWGEQFWVNAAFIFIAVFPLLYTSSFIRFILQNIRHSRLWG